MLYITKNIQKKNFDGQVKHNPESKSTHWMEYWQGYQMGLSVIRSFHQTSPAGSHPRTPHGWDPGGIFWRPPSTAPTQRQLSHNVLCTTYYLCRSASPVRSTLCFGEIFSARIRCELVCTGQCDVAGEGVNHTSTGRQWGHYISRWYYVQIRSSLKCTMYYVLCTFSGRAGIKYIVHSTLSHFPLVLMQLLTKNRFFCCIMESRM